MLRILGIIVLVIVVAVAGLFAFAAFTKPDEFRIERSVTINAPPEKVYPLIEDFHLWRDWSPFETMDVDLKRTYGGSERGLGATYDWEGEKTGIGRMEIVEAVPPSKVDIKLDFIKPMPATSKATFTVAPEGQGSIVTWAMTGRANLISKVMDVCFNTDKMIGGSFDDGLAKLKALAEQPAPAAPALLPAPEPAPAQP